MTKEAILEQFLKEQNKLSIAEVFSSVLKAHKNRCLAQATGHKAKAFVEIFRVHARGHVGANQTFAYAMHPASWRFSQRLYPLSELR